LKDLDAQWTDFRRELAGLAPRFENVADENDLEAALGELLDLWQEYPLLWMLLSNQGDSKRPPSPDEAPKFNPKETANKYYSLLDRLKASESPKEKAHDPRTNA
jgi:hypothetical protein